MRGRVSLNIGKPRLTPDPMLGSAFREEAESWPTYWTHLISAVVANAAPTKVVITFDVANSSTEAADWTVTGHTVTALERDATNKIITLTLSEAVLVYEENLTVTLTKGGSSYTHAITNNVLDDGGNLLYVDFLDLNTITESSNLVSKVEDKLGGAEYLAQGTSSKQPLIQSTGLLFNGVDEFLASVAALFTGANARSVWVMYMNLELGTYLDNICGQATGTTASTWFQIQERNVSVTGAPYLACYANDLGNGLTTPDSQWKIALADYDGTTARLFKNNVLIEDGAKTLNTANVTFKVGVSPPEAATNYGNCLIKAIIVRSSAPVDAVRNLIYNAIKAKFNFQENEITALNALSVTGLFADNINKRINRTPRHVYATAMHAYHCRTYYYNGKYYIVWMALNSATEKYNAMICTFDGTNFSDSYVAIAGVADEIDSHSLPAVIVDDNGYVLVSRAKGDLSHNLYVAKSDNPEDISAFTTIQTLTLCYHNYSRHHKVGTDIYMIARDSVDYSIYSICKKGLADDTYSAPVRFVNVTDIASQLGYIVSLRNEAENKIGLACQYLYDDSGNRNEPLMGYIETVDGVTFSNAAGTWSKDVVTDGFITADEFAANCILYDPVDLDDHNMCTDGFILNGVPYLLVEIGHDSSTSLDTYVDFTSLTIRYFSGGSWQTAIFPYSGMPFSRQFSEPQRFHFTHDGTNFVMFVWDSTFKTLHKYSSADLASWTDNGEVLSLTTICDRKAAFMGSCINRFDLMQMSFYDDGGGDLMVYKY